MRADARFKLGKVEGLGHAVVGAGIQPGHAVLLAIERGEQQHRQRRLDGAHPLQHGEAIDYRQTDVEHHHIELLMRHQVLGYSAVLGQFYLEAGCRLIITITTMPPQFPGKLA